MLTYLRTDARALPEDYLGTVKQTMDMLAESSHNYLPHAKKILTNGWVKPNKRIFDNSKISDHFAIIPTLQAPKNPSEPEQKLYDLVVRRFLAVFFPAAEFQVTTRVTEVAGHHFKTEGKVPVNPGWLEIYGREAQGKDDKDANLVPVAKGEKVKTDKVEAVGLTTKPPARYNEATLLSAMEGAGKLVDDDALREAMAGKGLGTPATRAAIIEGLLTEKYLVREGRELIPTAKAFQLMTLLRGLGVEELTQAELTGEWEHKLAQIERGRLKRDEFMREIAQMTQQIVKRAKEYDSDTIPGDYATLDTPCPQCGGWSGELPPLRLYRLRVLHQQDPGWAPVRDRGSRGTAAEEGDRSAAGFRSKMGRPFAAILKLGKDDDGHYKMEFDFGQNDDEGDGEPVDFSGQQAVGTCPKCGGAVFEHGMKYVCENTVASPKSCDFTTGKIILQQEISREQIGKLLTDGRTDLLTGFKSSRTGRNFKAFLNKQADGKIGFEFEAREPKAGAKPAAKSARAAAAADDGVATAESAVQKAPARKAAAKPPRPQRPRPPRPRQPRRQRPRRAAAARLPPGPRRLPGRIPAVRPALRQFQARRFSPSLSRKSMKARTLVGRNLRLG